MAKLLIVDDDDDLRDVLVEFLARRGHEVRGARDGEEGLGRLARDAPDAIILDVEMPRLDGPGMAARILIEDAGRERIPILLFSGGVKLPDVALSIGTPYYLPKPISPANLIRTLDRMLVERRFPRQAASA